MKALSLESNTTPQATIATPATNDVTLPAEAVADAISLAETERRKIRWNNWQVFQNKMEMELRSYEEKHGYGALQRQQQGLVILISSLLHVAGNDDVESIFRDALRFTVSFF